MIDSGDIFEFPFARNYFQTPGGPTMHYVDEGQGPAVLMVHGNPTWSYFYRKLIAALPEFRVIAPDHVGMGLSSRPTESEYGFRLKDRADDLAALINHLNIEGPIHLVVHDWGGPIGLSWAVANPNKIASVTIMNTGTKMPEAGLKMLPLRLAIFKHLGVLGSRLAAETKAFTWGTARFGATKPLPEKVEAAFLAPYQNKAERLAVAKFVEDIPLNSDHPSFEFLESIDHQANTVLANLPVALVWGLRDFVFSRKFFLDWQSRFPKAQTHVFPEAGHYLLEDEPATLTHIKNFIVNNSGV